MALKNLSPWNWFSKEQEQSGQQQGVAPARRTSGVSTPARTGDPFTALQDQMQTLFDDVARQFGMPQWPSLGGELASGFVRPSIDIKENENNYTLEIEIPGVNKDDVNVEVENDALIVRGEKRHEKDDSKDNYHVVERQYGSFQRVLDLPADADREDIKASFNDGVLRVTIGRQPEKARSGARQIEVQ